MRSLSPHLRSNHMGSSLKLRMCFITKHAMASKKGAIKKDALYDFESILVSALVSKGKRSEA